jgi:hypothetical protein
VLHDERVKRFALFILAASTGSLASMGCDALKAPTPAPFEVVIRVESDPGRPLAGVVIAKGGKDGPATGPDGKVTLKIPGQEGESVDLMVKCPADYITSTKFLTVSLRRGSKLPEYDWSCPPAIRHLVVALRADNGANLPVTYFGRTIGQTDANGAFTYLFNLKPGDGVELQLDTGDNKRIHPSNPTFSAMMKPYDDIVTFEQRFKVDPLPVHYVKGPERAVDILHQPPRPRPMPFPR